VSFHINRRTSPSASAGLRTRRSGETRRAEDDFLGIMQIAFPETRASARRYRMRARWLTARRVDATFKHAEFSSPDAIGARALWAKGVDEWRQPTTVSEVPRTISAHDIVRLGRRDASPDILDSRWIRSDCRHPR
jgi:hypothetical protein